MFHDFTACKISFVLRKQVHKANCHLKPILHDVKSLPPFSFFSQFFNVPGAYLNDLKDDFY